MEALAAATILGIPVPLVFAGVTVLVLALATVMLLGEGRSRQANRRVKAMAERVQSPTGPMSAGVVSIARTRNDSANATIDQLIKRLVPRRDLMRRQLEMAGWTMSLSRYLVVCAVVGAVAFLAMWRFAPYGLFAALAVGIAAGIVLPYFWLSRAVGRRQKKFTNLFPDAIDLIVRGLRAGLPIQESMRTVSREIEAPVGPEFGQISDSLRVGTPLEEALASAADRIPTPEFKFFMVSIAVQRETGGNLGETLANLSDIIRARKQLKLKVKALSSEARASAMIIGCLPLIMFFVLNMVSPGYSTLLIEDPRGQVMGVVGLVMMFTGFFIMNRMANFDP